MRSAQARGTAGDKTVFQCPLTLGHCSAGIDWHCTLLAIVFTYACLRVIYCVFACLHTPRLCTVRLPTRCEPTYLVTNPCSMNLNHPCVLCLRLFTVPTEYKHHIACNSLANRGQSYVATKQVASQDRNVPKSTHLRLHWLLLFANLAKTVNKPSFDDRGPSHLANIHGTQSETETNSASAIEVIRKHPIACIGLGNDGKSRVANMQHKPRIKNILALERKRRETSGRSKVANLQYKLQITNLRTRNQHQISTCENGRNQHRPHYGKHNRVSMCNWCINSTPLALANFVSMNHKLTNDRGIAKTSIKGNASTCESPARYIELVDRGPSFVKNVQSKSQEPNLPAPFQSNGVDYKQRCIETQIVSTTKHHTSSYDLVLHRKGISQPAIARTTEHRSSTCDVVLHSKDKPAYENKVHPNCCDHKEISINIALLKCYIDFYNKTIQKSLKPTTSKLYERLRIEKMKKAKVCKHPTETPTMAKQARYVMCGMSQITLVCYTLTWMVLSKVPHSNSKFDSVYVPTCSLLHAFYFVALRCTMLFVRWRHTAPCFPAKYTMPQQMSQFIVRYCFLLFTVMNRATPCIAQKYTLPHHFAQQEAACCKRQQYSMYLRIENSNKKTNNNDE